jgi:hypothetical protein
VPEGAAPVRVEVHLSSAPLQTALDHVEKGCLDCGDAKVLLGLRPDAEVRSECAVVVTAFSAATILVTNTMLARLYNAG